MKIKRIKKLRVNSTIFEIGWDKKQNGGSFSYHERTITIGTEGGENRVFMILNHELMEIVKIEMNVRFTRPDNPSNYIFVYDHCQFDTIMEMFTGLQVQFIL